MNQQKTEKFYTVSARLVFSAIIVVLVVVLILGLSIAINHGQILPLLGVLGPATTAYTVSTTTAGYTSPTTAAPLIVSVGCSANSGFKCLNPIYNYTTGNLTIALSQDTGYNWTSVTVRFVTANAVYSHGVPELSWSPPAAVNITSGLKSNVTKYVNIPITSGPVAVGTNITGSIWTKYQLQVGEQVSYANMSSAVIVIKRG